MKFLTLSLISFLALVNFSVAIEQKDTIHVYYLGGQSNMDGYGYNKELPAHLDKTFEDVWIFHGNPVPDENENGGKGVWTKLKPGHGTGFKANNTQNELSDRFGVELSFANHLQDKYPNQKIAIIKYARGGTSLDTLAAGNFGSWDPDFRGKNGINQYDHFLNTLKNAFAVDDINQDGTQDVLIPRGIVWMQGESDGAFNEAIASNYYDNLKRLMTLMRAAFRYPELPVVIGKISDSWNDDVDGLRWNHGNLIQYAQEKFVRKDPNAAIVRDTRYYSYSDPWHYDSEGYVDLGKKFADAIINLNHAEK